MKVLLLIDSLGSGGSERSTYLIARHLAARGVKVVVAALKQKKIGIETEFRALPITVHVCSKSGIMAHLKFLQGLLREERPDIAHSVLYESNVLLRIAKLRFSDVKVVQSLVNTPYLPVRKIPGRLGGLKATLVKTIDSGTSHLADIHYHVVSHTVLEHYRPILKMRDETVHLVHRGRVRYSEADERSFPTEGPFILVNVGRQEVFKDQQTAIKAIALLKQTYRSDRLRLWIYGRAGSETKRLNELIDRYDLADQVELRGFTDNMPEVYSQAHAFILPSLAEGAAGAMLEAMSARLPVLCSDISVLHEIIGSSTGALYFTQQDEHAAAERIRDLLEGPALYQRLSDYSYERYVTTFTEESSLNNMYAMYQKILREA